MTVYQRKIKLRHSRKNRTIRRQGLIQFIRINPEPHLYDPINRFTEESLNVLFGFPGIVRLKQHDFETESGSHYRISKELSDKLDLKWSVNYHKGPCL